MNDLEVWVPKNMIEGPLHLVEYKYGEGLEITFENENNEEITFSYKTRSKNGFWILASRFTDEMKRGDLGGSAYAARQRYDKSLEAWYLYKATNSDFIQWFDSTAGPGSEFYTDIEHHIYCGSMETFEVLSELEPQITIRTQSKD